MPSRFGVGGRLLFLVVVFGSCVVLLVEFGS